MDCIIRDPGRNVGGGQWHDLKTVAGYMRRITRSPYIRNADIYIGPYDRPLFTAEIRDKRVVKSQWHRR